MKRLQTFLISLGLISIVGATAVAIAPSAGAINVFDACKGNAKSKVCEAKDNDQVNSLVQNIINILLMATGIIAVIMIIIGGIRYTLSNGDSSQISSAKNTVLYAVIGLVVSILAYAIVNFVVGRF